MADFNALQAIINAYIKRNGVQAITGQILNGVLTGMVNALGKGYTVAGAASPTTDPGTMTGPLAYIAYTAGTYTHFDNIVVEQGEVSMLIYNEAEWHKEVLFSLAAQATVDDNIGVPAVGVSFVDGILTFDFRNMKGEPGENGQDGDPAGFGAISATITGGVGTPGVSVQSSGPDTAKNIAFQFTNLKGETGVTSCVVTVDNTTGNPSCAVSLVGQELHLDFSGLKGAQGDTGSSVDYPFTIVNNLTTDDATQALSAAMGVELAGQVSQLEHKVDEISNTEAVDLDEEIKVISEDGQTTILEITEDGVDAKNLKSNGVAVLTSHQDISGLATKTELEEGLAEKQDIIEELSIGEDMPASFTGSEMEFYSDDESEVYARVDENGISAKGFRLLSGETLKADSLGGKKWAVLGDSFTDGATNNTIPSGQYAGKRKVYPYFIGNRTGIDVISTFFASGRTLAWPENPGTFVNSICNPNALYYYQNIPADVDYITIYLGINDSHHSPGSEGGDGEDNTGEIPIGTISDNTTATYYGAWNVVLTWLRTNRPFAHIGIIVSNGCDEMAYRTAQIAVAKKYGIPYLDLNGDERCPAMIRPQNDEIPSAIKTIIAQAQAVNYPTNTHPNDDAHLFESYFIENFLRTI